MADDSEEEFTAQHLKVALEVYIPATQSIKEMTNLALSECSDIDLLPPEYRDAVSEEEEAGSSAAGSRNACAARGPKDLKYHVK